MYIILAEYNVPHPSLLRNKVTKSLKCTSSCCLVWLGSKSIILSSADVTAFYFCLKVRQFSCYHLRWLGKYIKGEIVVTVFNYKSECVCISSYASTLPLTQNVDTWSRPQSNLVEKYTHSWNCLFWQGYNVLLVNSKVAAGVFLIFSLRTSKYSFCTPKLFFMYFQGSLHVLLGTPTVLMVYFQSTFHIFPDLLPDYPFTNHLSTLKISQSCSRWVTRALRIW